VYLNVTDVDRGGLAICGFWGITERLIVSGQDRIGHSTAGCLDIQALLSLTFF
jgi:hypothetical protein